MKKKIILNKEDKLEIVKCKNKYIIIPYNKKRLILSMILIATLLTLYFLTKTL